MGAIVSDFIYRWRYILSTLTLIAGGIAFVTLLGLAAYLIL